MKGGTPEELRSAEAKASTIVAEARTARTKRMKEAKQEAEGLARAYRAEKEAQYQASMQKSLGSSGSDSTTLGAETELAINTMKTDYSANQDKVMDLLVHEVCHVKLVVPEGRKSRNMTAV
ncbi:unnamed protein product [Discosporangium mesarthrocarpum]